MMHDRIVQVNQNAVTRLGECLHLYKRLCVADVYVLMMTHRALG